MYKSLARGLLIGGIALLFTACSLPLLDSDSDGQFEPYETAGTTQNSTQDTVQDTVQDSSRITHVIANPAVKDLWDQSEAARKAGDYDTAALLLERALRIAPDDAVMWSRLAEIHLAQGNSQQAENLAAKSNAMTVDNGTLNYRNWLIIARARSMRGDDIGAQEAEYTAGSFRP
jgi:tetratricopeptide (TPR) repeat protein